MNILPEKMILNRWPRLIIYIISVCLLIYPNLPYPIIPLFSYPLWISYLINDTVDNWTLDEPSEGWSLDFFFLRFFPFGFSVGNWCLKFTRRGLESKTRPCEFPSESFFWPTRISWLWDPVIFFLFRAAFWMKTMGTCYGCAISKFIRG